MIFFSDSIDPDEMAHSKPFNQDLHCLPFCFDFLAGTTVRNDGSDQIKKNRKSTSETQG